MTLILPPLPFDKGALAPHISAETLDCHHGKHHKTYVDNANKLLEGNDLANHDIETIIRRTANSKDQIKIFNNVAQAYNHDFYWQSMASKSGENPGGKLADLIKKYYDDSQDSAKNGSSPLQFVINKLTEAALAQFGSGWGWLVYDISKCCIDVIKTSNADTPITTDNLTPLLTVDVWEHAYYIDHKNARAKYLNTFFEHLVNWKFAENNLRNIIKE